MDVAVAEAKPVPARGTTPAMLVFVMLAVWAASKAIEAPTATITALNLVPVVIYLGLAAMTFKFRHHPRPPPAVQKRQMRFALVAAGTIALGGVLVALLMVR